MTSYHSGGSVIAATVSIVKLASLPPSYYHLASSEILEKVPNLESRWIYYGPQASLIFSCGRDYFFTESGFPLPEIDLEVGGNKDITQLSGLLSCDNGEADSSLMSVSGPVTRSRTVLPSPPVLAQANLNSESPG